MSTTVQGSVNPRAAPVRTEGIDGDNSNDTWTQERPTTESGIRKYEAFWRAFQARKDQQTKQLQQKEKEIQTVTKYWAYAINNANTVANILKVQDWMTTMDETIRNARSIPDTVGSSKPPPTKTVQDSQENGTEVAISSGPTFGFDEIDLNEVNQPKHFEEFMMIFDDEEESSGSQHSTSKPKEKKKKKVDVTRKEFLSLQ